jgi:hypothetical protein
MIKGSLLMEPVALAHGWHVINRDTVDGRTRSVREGAIVEGLFGRTFVPLRRRVVRKNEVRLVGNTTTLRPTVEEVMGSGRTGPYNLHFIEGVQALVQSDLGLGVIGMDSD